MWRSPPIWSATSTIQVILILGPTFGVQSQDTSNEGIPNCYGPSAPTDGPVSGTTSVAGVFRIIHACDSWKRVCEGIKITMSMNKIIPFLWDTRTCLPNSYDVQTRKRFFHLGSIAVAILEEIPQTRCDHFCGPSTWQPCSAVHDSLYN